MHCFNNYGSNSLKNDSCVDLEVAYFMECPNRKVRRKSNELFTHCKIDHEYHVYNKFDTNWSDEEEHTLLNSIAVLFLRTYYTHTQSKEESRVIDFTGRIQMHFFILIEILGMSKLCLLYTSPSPRDRG